MQKQTELIWHMTGKIYRYNIPEKQIAFTNDVQAKRTAIFIGGLGDTILSINLIPVLNKFFTEKNIKFIVPQLRSMPHFQIHRIQDDIQDLDKVISSVTEGKIILIGHSTGCQVSMLYLQNFPQKCKQKIEKVFLQAPVSDVEDQEGENQQLGEVIQRAKKQKYIQYNNKIWLSQRLLSLFQRYGKEDLFSSYLDDEKFKKWKDYGVPITSVVSGSDEYMKKFQVVDKLKLGSKVYVIQGATHSLMSIESQNEFLQILEEDFKEDN